MLVCDVSFQLGFLHISKDVTYDEKNVTSSKYNVPTFGVHGKVWFVNVGLHRIIHDNLPKISQETIVTLKTTMYVIKVTHLEEGISKRHKTMIHTFNHMFLFQPLCSP
jgi:ABC-type arginine/histidine transport system permease subunit